MKCHFSKIIIRLFQEFMYFCRVNVEINIDRLRYLLSLYGMEDVELLSYLNKDRKRKFTSRQVFSSPIEFNILKKIDGLFGKGYPFYIDPSPIAATENMSVFFRKKNLGEDLNFTAKKVVSDYESLKNYLASLDTLSNITTKVTIPHCTKRTSPRTAAERVRTMIYPRQKCKTDRDFLKALISNLADVGVIVFEYLEAANKSEKANIDGFFLKPNFIVLKRYSYYRREIFTLLHELGHCILNVEEVESHNVLSLDYSNMPSIERWCNDFAYYFLVGQYADRISDITRADGSNDYQFPLIEELSRNCFISKRSLFTRLFYSGKMTQTDYQNVIDDLNLRSEQFKERQKAALKENDEDGRKQRISAPQPIYSPSYLRTLSVALNDGMVRPADLYRMKIPAKVVEGLPRWL